MKNVSSSLVHRCLLSAALIGAMACVEEEPLEEGDEWDTSLDEVDESADVDEPEAAGEAVDLAADTSPAVEEATDASSDAAELDIAATPTCNWVASYAGAWVPFYTGTNTVNCNMVVGCASEAVRKLQHSMNLCYGENLSEDGSFGAATRSALIRTQQKAGTNADGQYGPNTRRAMLHQAINGGCIRVP